MIILIGLIGVLVANSFEQDGPAESPAAVLCVFRSDC